MILVAGSDGREWDIKAFREKKPRFPCKASTNFGSDVLAMYTSIPPIHVSRTCLPIAGIALAEHLISTLGRGVPC